MERHLKDVVKHAKDYSGRKIIVGKYGSDEWMKQYGYENAAHETGAKYFHVDPQKFKSWSPGKQWAMNEKFLRNAVRDNARVYLATPHQFATGHYRREIGYLQSKGYIISSDGLYMHKP